MKPILDTKNLIEAARAFCEIEEQLDYPNLYGRTDGKAVGTLIEHKFQTFLDENYSYERGSSARGIDLPGKSVNTDIKVTSIRQPQSSCPFRNAQQKIFGLGYNLLVFVYDKKDNPEKRTAELDFVDCSFIEKERTGDYTVTKILRDMLDIGANEEDIAGYLNDIYLFENEKEQVDVAKQILKYPPNQGYWHTVRKPRFMLHSGNVVDIGKPIEGVFRLI